MPAAIVLGTSTFTMSATAGNAVDPERHSDAVLRHHAFRRARTWHSGFDHHARVRPVVARARRRRPPRRAGEGFGDGEPRYGRARLPMTTILRERATTAREFDPAEIVHGKRSAAAAAVRRCRGCRSSSSCLVNLVHVADRPAAARLCASSPKPRLGRHVACRGRRRLVSDRGARRAP